MPKRAPSVIVSGEKAVRESRGYFHDRSIRWVKDEVELAAGQFRRDMLESQPSGLYARGAQGKDGLHPHHVLGKQVPTARGGVGCQPSGHVAPHVRPRHVVAGSSPVHRPTLPWMGSGGQIGDLAHTNVLRGRDAALSARSCAVATRARMRLPPQDSAAACDTRLRQGENR